MCVCVNIYIYIYIYISAEITSLEAMLLKSQLQWLCMSPEWGGASPPQDSPE